MTRRGFLVRSSAAALLLAVGGAAAYQYRGLFSSATPSPAVASAPAAAEPTTGSPPVASPVLPATSRPILKPISDLAEEGNAPSARPSSSDPFASRRTASLDAPRELSSRTVSPAAFQSPAEADENSAPTKPAATLRRAVSAVVGDDSQPPAPVTGGDPANPPARSPGQWNTEQPRNELRGSAGQSPFQTPAAQGNGPAQPGVPAANLGDDPSPPAAPINSLRSQPGSPSGLAPASTAAGGGLSSAPPGGNNTAGSTAALGSPRFLGDALSARSLPATGTESPAPAELPTIRSGAAGAPDPSAGGLAGGGMPGGRHLEGPQSPSLVMEKTAPPEIQVGRPATFQVKVRNVGQAAADQVVVTDQVPKGTRLIDTTPRASKTAEGGLSWQLGSLPPGGEALITMQLLPETEGEIGSVAAASFQAQASVRTVCTRPQIVIDHGQPGKVLVGETLKLLMKIANRGSGAAQSVVIEEDVPVGLSHAAGKELEYEIGTLRPGEEKTIELTLTAEKAGVAQNVLVVRSGGLQMAEDRVNIEVVAPQLEVGVTGPKVRYLERAATYAVSVANPGTAPARDVELVTYLPKGMKFVAANQQGQYDPQTHAVFWSLVELPARQMGQVEVTALPIEQGEQKLRVEGRGQRGIKAQFEQTVSVEGLAALVFEVTDLADPIEVGKDTVYQIKVTNQGSKNAGNIQVGIALPPEMKAIAGEGPTKVAVEGTRASFAPLPRLGPGESAVFKLQVRGLKAGDQRVRVQLTSDDLQSPVTKEESTRVYADQ